MLLDTLSNLLTASARKHVKVTALVRTRKFPPAIQNEIDEMKENYPARIVYVVEKNGQYEVGCGKNIGMRNLQNRGYEVTIV